MVINEDRDLEFRYGGASGRSVTTEDDCPQASSSPTEAMKTVATDFRPGQTFRDCPNCPQLEVVPAGSFTMGSPASEPGRFDTKGPQRQVTIRQFAVGKFDVARGQWAAFVSATNRQTTSGCAWAGPLGEKLDPKLSWRKLGFPQDDTHPVVCVTRGRRSGLRTLAKPPHRPQIPPVERGRMGICSARRNVHSLSVGHDRNP
jgi:hypothetical protein